LIALPVAQVLEDGEEEQSVAVALGIELSACREQSTLLSSLPINEMNSGSCEAFRRVL
jgi:hypothetical protein